MAGTEEESERKRERESTLTKQRRIPETRLAKKGEEPRPPGTAESAEGYQRSISIE